MGAVVVKDEVANERAGLGSRLRLGEVELGIECGGEQAGRVRARTLCRSLLPCREAEF